jgi:hypothetical protein
LEQVEVVVHGTLVEVVVALSVLKLYIPLLRAIIL